ncbi:hypothetical protein [Kutzneria sp. NPDC051319]|uniref:hypothetical protein n=1 Tax=Kutzneria sp. NPDC051319 TaxID=3155047 RepID=UPI00342CD0CA
MVAGLVAGLLAAANGADVTTSVGTVLDTATSQEAETATSRDAAKKGNEKEAWQRLALKEIERKVKDGLRCSVQSFGQVQQFFVNHPCTKLDQLVYGLEDTNGNVIIGTVMWVTMPSAAEAEELRKVEDVYGSGDVTPFTSEILGVGGVKFTGQHYRARLDGPLFVISETEPLRGRPSDELLLDVATVADVLPPL